MADALKSFAQAESEEVRTAAAAWIASINAIADSYAKGSLAGPQLLPTLRPPRTEQAVGDYGQAMIDALIRKERYTNVAELQSFWRRFAIDHYYNSNLPVYEKGIRELTHAFDLAIAAESKWSIKAVSDHSAVLQAALQPNVDGILREFQSRASFPASQTDVERLFTPVPLTAGDYLLDPSFPRQLEEPHRFKGSSGLDEGIRAAYGKARLAVPVSFQGRAARALAMWLAVDADGGCRQLPATCRRNLAFVEGLISIVSGTLPLVGLPRDVYEAYLGEDLLTGEALSDFDRATRIVSAATFGISALVPKEAISKVTSSVSRFVSFARRRAVGESSTFARYIAELKASPRVASALTEVTRGRPGRKINWDVSVRLTHDEMDVAGLAWVGPRHTIIREPQNTLRYVSHDLLREYRPPTFRGEGQWTANLSEKVDLNSGVWSSNAHVSVTGSP